MGSKLFVSAAFAALLQPVNASALMDETRAFAFLVTQAESQATQVFRQLDADGSGGIDGEEATRSPQVTADFEEVDVDGNGVISLEEWKTYFNYPG